MRLLTTNHTHPMRNDTAAKVAAWNKLGKLHNHLFPSLFEAAEKLVRDGVKVFKVDGTFTRALWTFSLRSRLTVFIQTGEPC